MLQANVKCASGNLVPFIGAIFMCGLAMVLIDNTSRETQFNCPSPFWLGAYTLITYIAYIISVVFTQIFASCFSNSRLKMGLPFHLISNIVYILMILQIPIFLYFYKGCFDVNLNDDPNWGKQRFDFAKILIFGNIFYTSCYTVIIFCCIGACRYNDWWEPIGVRYERI